MSASLTTRTTLGLMPLAIGILLRHYYDRVLKDKNKRKNREGAVVSVPLRLEELIYDEAFTITRVSLPLPLPPACLNPKSIRTIPTQSSTMLDRTLWTWQQSASLFWPYSASAHLFAQLTCDGSHTVEELQQFTKLHTPVGPSSHVVRVTVPQTCCAEAAHVLVRAFGGEHEARRVVGGVRWWQVRPGDRGCVTCLLPPVGGADGCVRVYATQHRRGVGHG